MPPLSEVVPCELVWRYPAVQGGAFQLIANGAEIGRLQFDERPGAPSVGEVAGEKLTFQYSLGALPHVTISRQTGGETVAEYVPRIIGGGVVSFTTGARYCWNRAKIWSPTWCFRRQDEGHRSSICLAQDAGPLRSGGKTKICGDAAALPETPVLLLLAWYLRVLAFKVSSESIPGAG
jgi:hypothetical protein